MYSRNVLAVSGALIAAAAAVPMAGEQHHHQHHNRDIVWETAIDEVVVTVPVTKTVWVDADETPAAEQQPQSYDAPSSTPAAEPAAYTPSSPAAQAPAYTPQASSSSVYVAPPAYTPPASSSSVYVAPPAYTPEPSSSSVYVAPTTTSTSVYVAPAPSTSSIYVAPTPSSSSVYVAPTPESTYVAPAPSSTYVAPAASSPAASYGGGSSGALTFGMAKSGTSFTGDLTYYEPGMGACGFTNTTDQPIVAISEKIFDSYNTGNPNLNPLCQKWLTIKGKDGQDYKFEIVDRCPGCAEADLDLTEEHFLKVTSGADGRCSGMTWTID